MSTPDDRLEARLRRLADEADGPPDDVRAAALAALTTRTLDAELADLVADSWRDAEATLTRSVTADVRMLAFDCGDVTVEIDVETDAATRTCRVTGLVVGDVVEAVLVRGDARTPVALEGGAFAVDDVPVGPLRLELVRPDGSRVTTAWVSL